MKLSTICSWFDGEHLFDEIARPEYPPEKRPIPRADYKLIHQAVAEAVARGELSLVFGNDSVLGEKPTDIELDADASLYRPPVRLRAIELLPGALPDAWKGNPAKTTVGKLYSELKAAKGRPWPTRQFIDVLNEAINQGTVVRPTSGSDLSALARDADRELQIPVGGTGTVIPKPPVSGASETCEARLDLTQLQDFTEDAAAGLTKLLAGALPEFAVKIRLKGKRPSSLKAANELLQKIARLRYSWVI